MKNNILLVLVGFFVCLISQAQNNINYKAVINDNQGTPLSNQLVVIQFNILEGDDQIMVYSENHTPTTDTNGLIILNIGEGTVLSGDYTAIDWTSDTHFLNVQVNSGGGLTDLGTTQFLTVPYAISAQTAQNVNGLEAITEGGSTGWRLVGQNPDFFGDIGSGAVDLSQSDSDFAEYGAVGSNAVALGFRTRAESFAIAGGFDTTASGLASIAFGNESTASGLSAIAIGSSTIAQGDGATSIGVQTFAGGERSTAMGNVTTASGNQAVAIGSNVNARSFAETALGSYNTSYTPVSTTNFNSSDRLLVIGNGTASNTRSNAFILYKNGALQVGEESEATGVQSFASGRFTEASGATTTAMGNFSQALGDRSTALGFETQASGIQAVAIGTSSVASGEGAIALATVSNASGNYAMAFGSGTRAPSYRETVMGTYNTEYTPLSTTNFVSLDRLFVIGNGTGSLSRSNAFTILKNGNTGIGTSVPQERLHIANGRLRIGTETVEDTGSNRLEWNCGLFPDTDDSFQLGGSALRWEAVWATDGTINTSDRREKRDIQQLHYGLREILELNPVRFRWKAKPEQGEKLGLIAQDLLEIIPEVVKTHEYVTTGDDEDATREKKELDRLGVYYTDLIPVLVKAIQEQQQLIDQQNKKIDLLSQQTIAIAQLQERIVQLEQKNQ
ncbi:tail fiber domain-containing protein [uncultured Dokdonia sp.]|uniref:tail fiber domain-containing protein n=1 Tax=uncultured Dokdonia sp. TaxID=575653 RepID=UPI00262AC2F1|nr:tail fiber domain-containing protein [uncultured Dokdonia sp.]